VHLLLEPLITRGDLELKDLLPQLPVSVRKRAQFPHGDLPIPERMRPDAVWCCHQADGLLEVVAA
jgi:hypothetical protein